MDEIRVGSIVVIQNEAVYGGLSSNYRGKKVPKSQCSPTTHTVISIGTHYGEQEMRLMEIDSWVSARYLRLDNSHIETNDGEISTGILVEDQGSVMVSSTSKSNVGNAYTEVYVFAIVILLIYFLCTAIKERLERRSEQRPEQQLMRVSHEHNVISTYTRVIRYDPRTGYTATEIYKAEPIRTWN